MTDMPRPRPPFLSREVSRHGKPVWYLRRNGKRIRLRPEFGTPEFDAEYQAALATCQPPREDSTTAAGTLAWLIECFQGTAAWQARSESTRAKWGGLYRQVIETAGGTPLSAITQKAIRAGLERRAHTPGQAQHLLNAMRALFRWAVKAQLANRWLSQASAMNSQSLAELRVCRAPRTACARLPRPVQPMLARRSPSWRQSSDGRVARWHRFILELPTGSV